MCLPIHTYGGRGTLEDGVHFEEHAIIYTSSDPPLLLEAEQISEKFASVRVIPRSPREKLDKSSRVNYTKLYTIDYDIKMQVVGQIDKYHMRRFLNNVRLAHPSLSSYFSKAIIDPEGEFLGGMNSKGSSEDTATSAPQALDTKSISLPPSTVRTSGFASLGKASSQSSIKPQNFTSALDLRFTHLLLHNVVLPLKSNFYRQSITRAPFERRFRRLIRQASRFLFKVATTHEESQVAKFVGLRARNAAYIICADTTLFNSNMASSTTASQLNPTDQDAITYVSDDTNGSDLEGPEGDPATLPSPQDLQNMESFLESSGSLEWLRVGIKILLHPAGAFAQTVQQHLEDLWPRPAVLLAYPVTYSVCWELPLVLRYFYQPGTSIRSLMTITGNGVNAQAIACEHYLQTTWPDIAKQLLDLLDKVLANCDNASSTTTDAEITMKMLQPAEISTAISDDISYLRSYQTPTRVSVTASYEIQVHIASALSWLTSAIRYSDHGGLCLSKPNVCTVRRQEHASIIRIENHPLMPVHQPSCWHALFKKSVIAKGFPIRTRQQGHGLEIPIADAFHLAGTSKLIGYEDGFLAKGLCGALIPIKDNQFDDAIQWHLLLDTFAPSRGQISTTSSLLKSVLPEGWLKVNDPKVLIGKRAFVGWAGQAEVLIGTSGDLKLVDSSGAPECQSGKPHITAYNLSAGPSGMGIFGAGGGITFAPSTICSRFVYQRQKKLAYRLQDASTNYATIYDYANQTAWCIPESSLALCIAHNIIARRKLRVFRGGQITELGRAERCANGGKAAWVVLKDSLQLELKFEDDNNVLETFSNMLESIFINLDTVAEKLVEVINSHDKGNKQPPAWLLGYEFIDVAMEAKVMTLKEKEVKQPWTQICQDAGVVLFAGAIDDAIGPHIESLLCEGWRRPPPNRDLFVATTSAVVNFLERHGTENGSYLSESVQWEVATPLMQQHDCSGVSKCFHTQLLSTVSRAKRLNNLRQMLEAHKDGAFLFEKKVLRKPCEATLSQATQLAQASATFTSTNNPLNALERNKPTLVRRVLWLFRRRVKGST